MYGKPNIVSSSGSSYGQYDLGRTNTIACDDLGRTNTIANDCSAPLKRVAPRRNSGHCVTPRPDNRLELVSSEVYVGVT